MIVWDMGIQKQINVWLKEDVVWGNFHLIYLNQEFHQEYVFKLAQRQHSQLHHIAKQPAHHLYLQIHYPIVACQTVPHHLSALSYQPVLQHAPQARSRTPQRRGAPLHVLPPSSQRLPHKSVCLSVGRGSLHRWVQWGTGSVCRIVMLGGGGGDCVFKLVLQYHLFLEIQYLQ